jgi:hypothetical protein
MGTPASNLMFRRLLLPINALVGLSLVLVSAEARADSDAPAVEHLPPVAPSDSAKERAADDPEGAKDSTEGEEPGESNTRGLPSSSIECLDQHETAQVLQLEGNFRAASSALLRCSEAQCPEVIRSDCGAWLEELKKKMPGVIVRARGDFGDIQLASVIVDGENVATKLDGVPLQLDPGAHRLLVELSDGQRRELQVIVSQGEPVRVVEVDFRSPVAPVVQTQTIPEVAEPRQSFVAYRPLRGPAYILAGVSVIATGFAIGFGVDAVSEQDQAEDACAPNCEETVASRVRRSATASDIATVTAIVTGVSAIGFYFFGPVRFVPTESSVEATRRGSAAVGLGFGHIHLTGEF